MQEVFEKIIEKLEEQIEIFRRDITSGVLQDSGYLSLDTSNKSGRVRGLLDAQEIVNQAAAEYNNEWIPTSERLPEAGQEVYVTFTNKSTGKTYTELTKFNGEYFNSLNTELYPHITVDAWFALPPKYQPNGE